MIQNTVIWASKNNISTTNPSNNSNPTIISTSPTTSPLQRAGSFFKDKDVKVPVQLEDRLGKILETLKDIIEQ